MTVSARAERSRALYRAVGAAAQQRAGARPALASTVHRVASTMLVPIMVFTSMRIGTSTRVPGTGASQTDISRFSSMNLTDSRPIR